MDSIDMRKEYVDKREKYRYMELYFWIVKLSVTVRAKKDTLCYFSFYGISAVLFDNRTRDLKSFSFWL